MVVHNNFMQYIFHPNTLLLEKDYDILINGYLLERCIMYIASLIMADQVKEASNEVCCDMVGAPRWFS